MRWGRSTLYMYIVSCISCLLAMTTPLFCFGLYTSANECECVCAWQVHIFHFIHLPNCIAFDKWSRVLRVDGKLSYAKKVPQPAVVLTLGAAAECEQKIYIYTSKRVSKEGKRRNAKDERRVVECKDVRKCCDGRAFIWGRELAIKITNNLD